MSVKCKKVGFLLLNKMHPSQKEKEMGQDDYLMGANFHPGVFPEMLTVS